MQAISLFIGAINEVGKEVGFTVKGECGKSVANLDVSVTLESSGSRTKLYTKPMDSKRYLNRKKFPQLPHF